MAGPGYGAGSYEYGPGNDIPSWPPDYAKDDPDTDPFHNDEASNTPQDAGEVLECRCGCGQRARAGADFGWVHLHFSPGNPAIPMSQHAPEPLHFLNRSHLIAYMTGGQRQRPSYPNPNIQQPHAPAEDDGGHPFMDSGDVDEGSMRRAGLLPWRDNENY